MVLFQRTNPIRIMEIIGTGYGKNVQIGESYIWENVINMWDFPPKEAYTYRVNGITFTLIELTKTSDKGYNSRTLSKDEVTEEMIKCLEVKHGIKLGD